MNEPAVRLTTARALVRWMIAQRSELLDGTEVPLFAGVFAIFGHGNVPGLGTALHDAREVLPTWRGQNGTGYGPGGGRLRAGDRTSLAAVPTAAMIAGLQRYRRTGRWPIRREAPWAMFRGLPVFSLVTALTSIGALVAMIVSIEVTSSGPC